MKVFAIIIYFPAKDRSKTILAFQQKTDSLKKLPKRFYTPL